MTVNDRLRGIDRLKKANRVCAEHHSAYFPIPVYYRFTFCGALMFLSSGIKRLLLILLTPVCGIKAFILGCCCFNSVDNLSAATEESTEINSADFSDQWKQLWCCAGNSLFKEVKKPPFISHADHKAISVSVRLVVQLRQLLAFCNLSHLVSQLRCCHRLSGAPATESDFISVVFRKGTTRDFAVVLFLCLKSRQTRGIHYVFRLYCCLPDRCCPYLYGRRIA
jgi:hypothetical protein